MDIVINDSKVPPVAVLVSRIVASFGPVLHYLINTIQEARFIGRLKKIAIWIIDDFGIAFHKRGVTAHEFSQAY